MFSVVLLAMFLARSSRQLVALLLAAEVILVTIGLVYVIHVMDQVFAS